MKIKGPSNNFTTLGEVTYISLTDREGRHKEFAIIDTEDLERVKQFRWFLQSNNYVATSIEKYTLLLHHFILDFYYDFRIDLEPDHINRNGLDNRKSNLRLVTRSINNFNTDIRSTNTSGVKGVSYKNREHKWEANITVRRKHIHLGVFKTKEEAIAARQAAERKYL